MQLEPGGIRAWIIVGLIAGWLASMVTGGTRGIVGDLMVPLRDAVFWKRTFSGLEISTKRASSSSPSLPMVSSVCPSFLSIVRSCVLR
jgi:uncharacterized membrane protein YeaQ/YmgE (transglycosylase-associated protein family)